ncbi:MAG: beta-propeller domain-containing protein [Candidatus Aenigmatarchaeota archaeon]
MFFSGRKGVAPLLAFALIVIVSAGIVFATIFSTQFLPKTKPTEELKKFYSCEQINSFIKENAGGYGYGFLGTFGTPTMTRELIPMSVGGAEKTTTATEFSTTNIQVEGVDEPDIVKNDGKYIYTVSGNSIFIINAYPPEESGILSQINSSGVQEIFINDDRIVVFGVEYPSYEEPVVKREFAAEIMPYPMYSPRTYIRVYDVSDKYNPVLKRNISIEGNYYDARMIGDYVYVIVNKDVYFSENGPVVVPMVYSEQGSKPVCKCSDIYYFGIPDYGYQFVTIASINVKEDSGEPNTKVIMSGYTDTMYVSARNVYLSYMKRMSWQEQSERFINAIKPFLPSEVSIKITQTQSENIPFSEKMERMGEAFQDYYNSLSEEEKEEFMNKTYEAMEKAYEDIAKETEKTAIHKISIENGQIEYRTKGEVQGRLLNQFSLDESNGFLRVATTTSGSWDWRTGQQVSPQKNHVYVLDAGMSVVGKLEDLAPGESIYSARFIGDRAYLVTFKKIDPLFVIDLSEPTNPSLLGKLKIPGYSDYLHPYDENHIIGIGKETVEAEEPGMDFAWYQGVKLALFDVSDPNKPKEISKYVIGDRGTESYALRDHKAFLFSRQKNLLVIPILLAEIDESQYPKGVPSNAYGDYTFQGAYVFKIDLEDGFSLKGRVTHSNEQNLKKSGWYWYSPYSIQRSLYIDDVLYTVSQGMVKANSLSDLSEIKAITIPVAAESVYKGVW